MTTWVLCDMEEIVCVCVCEKMCKMFMSFVSTSSEEA